jgi:hypothetical protein
MSTATDTPADRGDAVVAERRRRATLGDMFVVVAGPPASGKSTLGIPTDVEQSHRLGRAAVSAMIATARLNSGAVLDSVWLPYTVPLLRGLAGPVVEVRCQVSRETAAARYRARVPSGTADTSGTTALPRC